MSAGRSLMTASRAGHTRAWDRFKTVVRHIGGLATRPLRGPGAEMASWPLSPNPYSVRRARRLTRAQLANWHVDGQSDIAELLVSELVTNALRHAMPPIRLTLWSMEGTLRCEVADADPRLPRPQRPGDYDEEGRGIRLLDQLACCWGSTPTSAGKAIWFELSAAPSEPASPPRPALNGLESG